MARCVVDEEIDWSVDEFGGDLAISECGDEVYKYRA